MAVSVYTGAGGGVASFNGRKGNVVPANGDYTKAQVGLSNVDNVKQYSASNPPPYPVTSVAGKTGAVTLAASDVGLGNVDNTSDANKPISNATQAALNDKQSKITANGILKGDGTGTVIAAEETEVELVELTADSIGASPKSRILNITLPTASWAGSGPYTQTVAISGGTANTKVDLQAGYDVIAQMLEDGCTAIYVQNDSGVFTAYAVGEAPSAAITVQGMCSEVTV